VASPTASNAASARGGPLDALRFLASAFIVVFHLGDDAPVPLRQMHDVFGRGYLATDFFLMLSGFVLARIYGEAVLTGRVSPGQFFARRAARNYPTHLITLAGLVAMVLLATAFGRTLNQPGTFRWDALPAHLLMVHGWGFAPDTWNVPTWSISALLVCYAAFPWIWPLYHRLGRVWACIAAAALILIGADLAAHAITGGAVFDLPFRWGLLRAVPLFLVGLALARLVQVAHLGRRASGVALGALAVAAANVACDGPDLLSIAAIAAVIVGCGALPAGRPWPGAEWGARISFSLFFTHTLSDAVYNDGFKPVLLRLLHPCLAGQWAIWWGALVFALAAAAAYHYLVDEPVQRWVRQALFRGSPARRPAPAPSA
jgi:peptidoglycan/LPS O-acetylase OafA/YrhL